MMSSRPGESFERAIAYILTSAGFVVREQPHFVRVSGETVGDFDVLSFDPKSNITVAVTCKEWRDQAPQAKDFNHFLSLMDLENIRHGIVAWTNVPSSVFSLVQNAEKRGYRFSVIDSERYDELHNFMLNGQNDKIEDYLRRSLGLAATSVPSVGQQILLRKAPAQRRTTRCTNLLPLHHQADPPSYLINPYFRPTETKLKVKSYLFAIFHCHKEARVPGTGELLDEIDQDIEMLCDAVTGKYPPLDDHVHQVVRNHWTEAYPEHAIEEEDFLVAVEEPKINRDGILHKMRIDATRSLQPLHVTWVDAQEREHERQIEVSPSDLRETYTGFISVPIWHVKYDIGSHSYMREFYATDGTSVRDDFRVCRRCNHEPAVAVCTKCDSTIGSQHMVKCKSCDQLFCDVDSLVCAKCSAIYCKDHAAGAFCVTCGAFLDSPCKVHCTNCGGAVCPRHIVVCVKCGRAVCPSHMIEHRYMLMKRQFCSESCYNAYDLEFRQKGTLHKVGHVIKQKR